MGVRNRRHGRYLDPVKTSLLAALTASALLVAGCSGDERAEPANGGSLPGSATETAPEEAVDVSIESSTVPQETSEALRAALAESMEANGVPGAVVSLTDPQLGDWEAVAGVADVAEQTAMSPDLQWPIRSITKSFTVTVLLQLVEEGKVSLDDTIGQWVPGIPNGDVITLGQLADMTSGVPDYTGDSFVEDFSADPTAAFTREQLIEYVREGEPSSEPGEDRHYINSSTVLLGEVIEQVEGAGFESVVSERILDPLGLGATAYPTEVDGFTGEHATGYQPDEEGPEASVQNFTVFDTAGAMTSDVDDLQVWGRALATGELLEQQTFEDRLVGSAMSAGPEYDTYASGIGELGGWWGHTGEGFGYTTLVMHQPETGATAVVLMNISNLDEHVPTALFREIADILS